jgi:hypothetical protein
MHIRTRFLAIIVSATGLALAQAGGAVGRSTDASGSRTGSPEREEPR